MNAGVGVGVGKPELTVLDLPILEIVLKYPGRRSFINQKRLWSGIIRCPRTSRSIHPTKHGIIIHCIPQDLKLFGRRHYYSVSKMLSVEGIISDGSPVDEGFGIVRP